MAIITTGHVQYVFISDQSYRSGENRPDLMTEYSEFYIFKIFVLESWGIPLPVMYHVIAMYKDMMMAPIGSTYMRHFSPISFWTSLDPDNDKLLDGIARLSNCHCIFNTWA